MKPPETAIDVKMFEFGRLIDGLLDASHAYELAEQGRHSATAKAEYREARERLMGAIRTAVASALSSKD